MFNWKFKFKLKRSATTESVCIQSQYTYALWRNQQAADLILHSQRTKRPLPMRSVLCLKTKKLYNTIYHFATVMIFKPIIRDYRRSVKNNPRLRLHLSIILFALLLYLSLSFENMFTTSVIS